MYCHLATKGCNFCRRKAVSKFSTFFLLMIYLFVQKYDEQAPDLKALWNRASFDKNYLSGFENDTWNMSLSVEVGLFITGCPSIIIPNWKILSLALCLAVNCLIYLLNQTLMKIFCSWSYCILKSFYFMKFDSY